MKDPDCIFGNNWIFSSDFNTFASRRARLNPLPPLDRPYFIENEFTADVRNEINKIENIRERYIIKRYHGIGSPAMILEDIGKSLGITRERVRQLYWLALRRMSRNPVLRSYRKDSH